MKSSSALSNIELGDHSCFLYESNPVESLPLLVPYINQALAHGQQFIYIADDQSVTELSRQLEVRGIDVQRESERGALKLWTRKEWRQPGKLDSAKKALQVRELVNRAKAQGFTGARFAVEMTWTLGPDIDAQDLAYWEATINAIFAPGFPGSIACLYNRSRLGSDVILAGLHTHPTAVIGNECHQNAFYEAPLILKNRSGSDAEALIKADRVPTDGKGAGLRVDWMLSQLAKARTAEQQHVGLAQAQAALAEAERARQAIEASERRFRILADTSPVLIWMSGPAGCEFVNRTFIEFFGRPEPELLGSGWKQLIHAEDYARFVQAYEAAVSAHSEFEIELRARHNDGQWRWLLCRGAPYCSPEGTLVGYVGTSTDIHDQRQAGEISQRLAAIVESSDDAIIGKDLDGVITSWNKGAERIFGYCAEEAIGQSIYMLIPAERRHEEPDILARLRRGERIEHYETVRRRKDGSLIHISLTVSPVRNRFGVIVGASKIARNITERIRREHALQAMQDELAHLNAQLEDRVRERTAELADTVAELEAFSYSITHDLRAPLRSMQSFATMLEQDCAPQVDETGKDYIRRIVGSARRMDRLIQDVLSYSRMARSELKLEPVDVEHLVQGIIESYPGFRGPQAIIDVRRPLLPVLANEAALTQCLSNLISNAIKFVEPSKVAHIVIWTELAGNRIRINVRDNGIGIPARHQERIFGIFQRLSKAFEGTGIGLSIVKKAAERMGGQVGLSSEPGKGSTFWLDLQSPRLEAKAA